MLGFSHPLALPVQLGTLKALRPVMSRSHSVRCGPNHARGSNLEIKILSDAVAPPLELLSSVSSETMVDENGSIQQLPKAGNAKPAETAYTTKVCPVLDESSSARWIELSLALTASTLLASYGSLMPISLSESAPSLSWSGENFRKLVLLEAMVFVLYSTAFDAFALVRRSTQRVQVAVAYTLAVANVGLLALLHTGTANLFQEPFINTSTLVSMLLGVECVLLGILYLAASSTANTIRYYCYRAARLFSRLLKLIGGDSSVEKPDGTGMPPTLSELRLDYFEHCQAQSATYLGVTVMLTSIPFWIAGGVTPLNQGWSSGKEICWWVSLAILAFANCVVAPVSRYVNIVKTLRAKFKKVSVGASSSFKETIDLRFAAHQQSKFTLLLVCLAGDALSRVLPSLTGFYASPFVLASLSVAYLITFLAIVLTFQAQGGARLRQLGSILYLPLCVGLVLATVGFSELNLASQSQSQSDITDSLSLQTQSESSGVAATAPSLMQPFSSEISNALSAQLEAVGSSDVLVSLAQVTDGEWLGPLFSVWYGDASNSLTQLKVGTITIVSSVFLLQLLSKQRVRPIVLSLNLLILVLSLVLLCFAKLSLSVLSIVGLNLGLLASLLLSQA